MDPFRFSIHVIQAYATSIKANEGKRRKKKEKRPKREDMFGFSCKMHAYTTHA